MPPNVIEVAADTYAVRASHTNLVVIVDGTEVTLVDSGYPRDRTMVQSALREIGRDWVDVQAMVLTHAHVDHMGSAEWARSRVDIPVHCHEDEAAHARGEVEEAIGGRDILPHLWRPGVARFTLNVVRRGGLRRQPLEQVITFPHGQPVDVPGRPVAIHTPGHTSGHVGFHLPDRGVLIAGDALITVDVWNRSRRGPQVIRPPFNHDHSRAIESLASLESLEADVVVPGHGRPYRGTPAQAVAEAREREGVGSGR